MHVGTSRARRPAQPVVGLAAATAVVLALAGCGQDAPEPAASSTPSSVAQRIDETVEADLGGVRLTLEVADEPQERAVGMMGREEVPPGTGMVFDFDEPVSTSFYMFQVPVPLTAVFIRDGVVVHVAQMAPCAESDSAKCPLYGPGEPFDTVVETAPQTLPDVEPGDRFTRG